MTLTNIDLQPSTGLKDLARSCMALLLGATALAASANNVGENAGWQFQTSTDQANAAVVQDMIMKRRSGYYAAPTYTTTIGRQFNCNVTATAKGNEGNASTVANSPSNSGASATSTGNANATQIGGATSSSSTSAQDNSGGVGSTVNGSTTTSVTGTAAQTIDSNQTNGGTQNAAVGGSPACTFGPLN